MSVKPTKAFPFLDEFEVLCCVIYSVWIFNSTEFSEIDRKFRCTNFRNNCNNFTPGLFSEFTRASILSKIYM